MVVVIQKVNALYQKIPFRFGIALKGAYKGYHCEIRDLTSRGNYIVSINFTQVNLNPDQILPKIEEKPKINKELQDLKRKEYSEDPVAQQILEVTKGNIEILYKEMYNQTQIGINFLVLIFDKIKKQFEKSEIKEETLYELEEPIDYEATYEQLVNLNSNTAEYLDDPVTQSLLTCTNLLQLNSNADFVNSHSIELQNKEKSVKNYNRREHLNLLITAYFFVFFNQLSCQIDSNLLTSLGIIIRPNDNPETIIRLLEFFEYIKRNNEHKIINYIEQLEKIDNLQRIHPSVIRHRFDAIIGTTTNEQIKYKEPEYNSLLPLPIKHKIEEPIKHYILEKIEKKIKSLKDSNEELRALKILQKGFLNKTPELIQARKDPRLNKYYKVYYTELKNRQNMVEKKIVVKRNSDKDLRQIVKKDIEDRINKLKITDMTRKILVELLRNFDDKYLRYVQTGNPDYANIVQPYLHKYLVLLRRKYDKNNQKSKTILLLNKFRHDTLKFIKESKNLKKTEIDYLIKNFDNIVRNGPTALLAKGNPSEFDDIIYKIYTEYINTRFKIIVLSQNTLKITK